MRAKIFCLRTDTANFILPSMKEGGGYIFASDHSIPNSVSYKNMKEIARLAHELGKY